MPLVRDKRLINCEVYIHQTLSEKRIASDRVLVAAARIEWLLRSRRPHGWIERGKRQTGLRGVGIEHHVHSGAMRTALAILLVCSLRMAAQTLQ
jgi:hypothetical protein